MIIKLLFLIVLFLLLYEFIFFPIFIFFINLFIPKKKYKYQFEPNVSVIIVTRNSENYILKRINNIWENGYPKEKMEIIICVDKSDDKTARIVENIPNIKYFISEKRVGKPTLINKGVELSKNNIIIFTDDNVSFEKNAITFLIKPFYFNNVGGVSGAFIVHGNIIERLFQKLENFIKYTEGKLGMVIGAYGPIYAIKKELFEKLPENKLIMEDFINTLNVLRKGKKFIFQTEAIAFEDYNKPILNDLLRKKRIGIGDYNSFPYIWQTMKKRINLFFYFFLFSHKLLRWFTAPLLFLLLFFNLLIPYKGLDFYNIFFLLQFTFYLFTLIFYFLRKRFISFILGYFFLFWGFLVSKEEKNKPFWDI